MDPLNWVGVAYNRRFTLSFIDAIGNNCVGRPLYHEPMVQSPYVSFIPPPFDVESWLYVPAPAFYFFPVHVFG